MGEASAQWSKLRDGNDRCTRWQHWSSDICELNNCDEDPIYDPPTSRRLQAPCDESEGDADLAQSPFKNCNKAWIALSFTLTSERRSVAASIALFD